MLSFRIVRACELVLLSSRVIVHTVPLFWQRSHLSAPGAFLHTHFAFLHSLQENIWQRTTFLLLERGLPFLRWGITSGVLDVGDKGAAGDGGVLGEETIPGSETVAGEEIV